jgi:CRISPR-associated endonuclease/helicase Cas3
MLADPRDAVFSELLAYAIAGHHAGLPDKSGVTGSSLGERIASFDAAGIDPAWKTEIGTELGALRPAMNWRADSLSFQLSLLGRMVFSALVDADFKATEAFYAGKHGPRPDRNWPELGERLDQMIVSLDLRLAELARTEGPVARLRGAVVAHVRAGAAREPGLYTLTVPTGGGKTLTSLGFALDHARAHSKRRIIYAIPFTAIVDQTASQFRQLFGDEIVLEHHSAMESQGAGDGRRGDSDFAGRDKLRLAMEDWSAPLVVTTSVQLFESLFASRTSAARKLHNIANSIIVLDEAQTLPRSLLLPILRTLEALALDYGCTIVLCTATQPALDKRHLSGGLALEGRELAPDPTDLVGQLRRVTLRQAGALADGDLINELRAAQQALVIVNSRGHALALHEAAQANGLDGLIHLSTRMCAAHRRPLFEVIKKRLRAQEPCRVISTSLIEAGVDVDFPRVWRAEAGLDQIAQAAGRCNREGVRPVAESIVTVFEAPDNPPPHELKQLSNARKRMQDKFTDLFSPEAMTAYFREVYWQLGAERLDRGVVDRKPILSKFALEGGATEFSYRSAAENFRMIESGMLPVVVPFDEAARRSIAQLKVEAIPSGRLARELQTYIVQVPPQARHKLIAAGRARVEAPDLRADQFVVLTDLSLYREEIGLVWEDADYLGTESLVQV